MSTQKKVQISDKSIDRAGLPKNINEVISEYIWNGFDAKATKVDVKYTKNDLEGVNSICIKDNGLGIDYDNLDATFGLLLDSQKKALSVNTSYVKGDKGKGRFAFTFFSVNAYWHTTYEKQGKKYAYTITIKSDNKHFYDISDKKEVDYSSPTGTEVTFDGLNDHVTAIDSPEFISFLKREYGWYLHLRRKENVTLQVNNKQIDYADLINASKEEEILLESEGKTYKFNVDFIEWKYSIGDDFYYFYFLDPDYRQRHKKTTTFNKNKINFHHSVYVKSDFFSKYAGLIDVSDKFSAGLFDGDTVYKELLQKLHDFLEKCRRDFIERNSETLIGKLEEEGVMPQFNENKYDQERKKDFIDVTKTIYKIEPKLFIGASELHKKSFLSMLNLLLDSDERDNLLVILDSLVNGLNKDDRYELATLLKMTSLKKIVRTVRDLSHRYKNVEIIKSLVFDFGKFTNERDHIQKIMEDSFWLFGEQYNAVVEDKTWSKSLESYYIKILEKDNLPKPLEDSEANRRPDLFLARKIRHISNPETRLEENIILELKEPRVKIGMEQYRQVQDYLELVKEPQSFQHIVENGNLLLLVKN